MNIHVYTLNEKGKIELTKDELAVLLNEAYKEGTKQPAGKTWLTNQYTWCHNQLTSYTGGDITNTAKTNGQTICGVSSTQLDS